MATYRPGTFDSRVIEYEKIHHITEDQIQALKKAVDIKPAQKILDGCCGYGSATKWLLNGGAVASTCSFFLLDESEVQIERAKENLQGHSNTTFTVGNIKELPFEDNFFDTVIIKMGLHENPKEIQFKIVSEVFRVLKQGGKFVVWELYLNKLTQPIFQSYIHKKDELAGFEVLAQKRYFPRGEEIKEIIDSAGFENFTEHYVFQPILGTRIRLNELISRELKESGQSEATADLQKKAEERVDALNNFFRNELTQEQKEVINFKDEGDNIVIYNIDKAIVSAIKPV